MAVKQLSKRTLHLSVEIFSRKCFENPERLLSTCTQADNVIVSFSLQIRRWRHSEKGADRKPLDLIFFKIYKIPYKSSSGMYYKT